MFSGLRTELRGVTRQGFLREVHTVGPGLKNYVINGEPGARRTMVERLVLRVLKYMVAMGIKCILKERILS